MRDGNISWHFTSRFCDSYLTKYVNTSPWSLEELPNITAESIAFSETPLPSARGHKHRTNVLSETTASHPCNAGNHERHTPINNNKLHVRICNVKITKVPLPGTCATIGSTMHVITMMPKPPSAPTTKAGGKLRPFKYFSSTTIWTALDSIPSTTSAVPNIAFDADVAACVLCAPA